MVAGQHIVALTREYLVATGAADDKVVAVASIDQIGAANHQAGTVAAGNIFAGKGADHPGAGPSKLAKVTGQPVDTTAAGQRVGASATEQYVVVTTAAGAGIVADAQSQC